MSITASIRHDITGLSALNRRKQNQGKLSASLEKLASGYKINRSADDAAGLAISEKMRLELTGLDRAVDNSKDGIRLIQTGEGALDEIHAMLKRLTLLAEQSANGTYQDEVDRENLQKELEQLCNEVGRIVETTNYNGVELFQDIGYEMERYVEPYYRDLLAQITLSSAAAENRLAARSPEGGMTLEQLRQSTRSDELNIIYIEHDFDTTQSGAADGPATGVDNAALNLEVEGTGKKLSEVLKTSIVPQTVQNLLANYPAFGYLKGSSIGIGLRLYNNPGDNTMASVTGGVDTANLQSFMLSVNIAHITESGGTVITEENRSKLEATIAHEMIHAFMDEATTAGMFGYNSATGKFEDTSHTFPSWFIEGMAQTASGPGNWLKKPVTVTDPDSGTTTITRYGGLEIDASSTEAEIKAAISAHKLNASKSATSASQYGTGYLACMYLGSAVAARIDGKAVADCADAASISAGLNQLLSEVINGSSLNSAIAKYTDFTNTTDFQTKFNNGTADGMLSFVHQLLTNTGGGLGGIVTGDLTASDLASNAELSGIKLFELNTDHSTVNNIYPSDHEVLTGGTTGASGTKPSEFTPLDAPKKEFGDFEVYGTDLSGVAFDGTDTLTVSGTGNVRIAMKPGVTGSAQKINVTGAGTVTLDGVDVAGLNIQNANAQVRLSGKNTSDTIAMDSGAQVAFDGDGQMKTDIFTADNTNTVHCGGGALIVGDGTGAIGTGTTVIVDGAAVAAGGLTGVKDSANTDLEKYEIDWNKLSKLTGNQLTAVSVDGTKKGMLLDSTDPGVLWLDKKPDGSGGFQSQKIVFSGVDASGKQVSQTYSVKWDDTASQFVFSTYNVFEVIGGTEGTDWDFDGDTNTLKILTNTALTIKGGTKTIGGETDYGTIKIEDNVNAKLTLDGVEIDASKLGGNTAGIQLGNGSDVKLTMNGTNTITGSGEAAGIQLYGKRKRTAGDAEPLESSLHIDMQAGSTLNVTGGTISNKGGAGIGIAWASTSKGSIEIIGEGTINANGGNGGAGIGGSEGGDMGDISIAGSGGGLSIKTVGGSHGAGIGSGGWVSNFSTPDTQVVGDITITGTVDIDASSKSHGTGIGSACHSTAGNITIGENPAGNPGVNDGIKIKSNGGNDGAAIGSGWEGVIGEVTIWGGEITAMAGTNSCGIGSGMDGSIEKITINGGTITAKGGWTYDGGNIGGYDPNGKEIKVSMPDPNDLTIKAGPGEGMYITTGTFDKDGNQLFALEMGYINKLLGNSAVTSDPPGSTALVFPLSEITATMDDGTVYTWDNIKHMGEGDAYIWMKGQDIKTLTVAYEDNGTAYKVEVPLKYKNGLWRYTEAELPKEPPPKPGFTGDKPVQPGQDPVPDPVQPDLTGKGGIILQIGTGVRDILAVPRFFLSRRALKLDKLDISTQSNAMDSMPIIREAVNRVSEIRGSYGALSNRLEHNITNLQITSENLTDAESTLRDTDMAMEMTNYIKQSILSQASQAMLAQCNQRAGDVMRLLQ